MEIRFHSPYKHALSLAGVSLALLGHRRMRRLEEDDRW